jgi:tetratricopeptide (TPR) repeat protein
MKASKTNINRLYHQLSRSIDTRPNSARTLALADHLEAALSEHGEKTIGAIFAKECRSLISEAKGDLDNAIKHREDEIRLIRHLHDISQHTPGETLAFNQYGFGDLQDRLELLAVLYHDNGQFEKALSKLNEAKQLCLQHDLQFDAEDILREYSDERPSQTLYLQVSENGVLSAKEESSDLRPTMMPSTNGTTIGQKIQKGDHLHKLPKLPAEHFVVAGESITPSKMTKDSASLTVQFIRAIPEDNP